MIFTNGKQNTIYILFLLARNAITPWKVMMSYTQTI
uniref:Uncharacterized protein n=1 Tax=Arundo donax TaxID=35708 RepID=A0A0A9F9M0_ARUDO